MTDPFIEAQRKRKRRTKWWREHIVLAYVAVTGMLMVGYLFGFVLRQTPSWLMKLGVGPSGAALISGTISCGFGVLGLQEPRNTGLAIAGVLCLLGGVIALARGLGLF